MPDAETAALPPIGFRFKQRHNWYELVRIEGGIFWWRSQCFDCREPFEVFSQCDVGDLSRRCPAHHRRGALTRFNWREAADAAWTAPEQVALDRAAAELRRAQAAGDERSAAIRNSLDDIPF